MKGSQNSGSEPASRLQPNSKRTRPKKADGERPKKQTLNKTHHRVRVRLGATLEVATAAARTCGSHRACESSTWQLLEPPHWHPIGKVSCSATRTQTTFI